MKNELDGRVTIDLEEIRQRILDAHGPFVLNMRHHQEHVSDHTLVCRRLQATGLFRWLAVGSGACLGRAEFTVRVPFPMPLHIVDSDIADRTERSVILLEDDCRVAGNLHS